MKYVTGLLRTGSILLGLGLSGVRAAVIFGGPAYDSTTSNGYQNPLFPIPGFTAGNGVAVTSVTRYDAGGDKGVRAMRWDTSSAAATELGTLGTDSNGYTYSFVYAMNEAGTMVGYARRQPYDINGDRPVRWDSTGNVTELQSFGGQSGTATAINDSGATVGYVRTLNGSRAVRWQASGTGVTQLGHIGLSTLGSTECYAFAVNSAGTAIGSGDKYAAGAFMGQRGIRWDASSTEAIELGTLGTTSTGYTFSRAWAINSTGTAVGFATRFVSGEDRGIRAVRWDESGIATELDHLGTDTRGSTSSYAYAINDSGMAVGYAKKHESGKNRGLRAVRWDASGAVEELGNLGAASDGSTEVLAHAINADGTAVGEALKYIDGTFAGRRAVAWGSDGLAIDLNKLLSPTDAALWTLTAAWNISDTNWVTGTGTYDPDGPDPLPAYQRAFLLQIPEPALLPVLGLAALVLTTHRTRKAGQF